MARPTRTASTLLLALLLTLTVQASPGEPREEPATPLAATTRLPAPEDVPERAPPARTLVHRLATQLDGDAPHEALRPMSLDAPMTDALVVARCDEASARVTLIHADLPSPLVAACAHGEIEARLGPLPAGQWLVKEDALGTGAVALEIHARPA